jgi:hypothetical protein
MLHLFAHMGITTMSRTLARLTATTDRIGSTAAYLLEPGHGSTAFVEVIGAEAASAGEAALLDAAASTDAAALLVAVVSTDAAALLVAVVSTDAAALLVADPDSPDKADLHVAGQWDADLLVVASAAIAVPVSTVEVAVDSTAVEAVSTVEVAVDSTAVAEATVAATGKLT